MAGDTSLWPIVASGLLTGLFALGGIGVGLVGAARRDVAQERREARKRREVRFEELVAAVYEFDHWLETMRQRDAFGDADAAKETASPFAKVQSISAVYFPQFSELIGELDRASDQYRLWIYKAVLKRVAKNLAQLADGFDEASLPYVRKREALLDALKKFAHEHFQ
jgi:hypothetical protein